MARCSKHSPSSRRYQTVFDGATQKVLRILLILLALISAPITAQSLAERLGYSSTDRLLIVNADDVGMSHEANTATSDGMENGQMTSGSIMVPCPWFSEIAQYAREHPQADFGLHLTHTSEWKRYKWRPLTPAPGLADSLGYLWRSIEEVYRHASPAEVEAETRAQIERALLAGIDVTHLDSHMGTLQYDPRFHEPYLKLAKEYDLPMRVASSETLAAFGMSARRESVTAAGIVYPAYLIHDQRKAGETLRAYWTRIVSTLNPGVTELYIHPAMESEALKRMTSRWRTRVEEHALFTNDTEMLGILRENSVKLIGWRVLRDLQRRD
jgi:chitin disaccharide deacetylase